MAGGKNTSQRHQNELGGSTGLYSQTTGKGGKSQELSVSLWHRLSSWPLFEVSFVVLVSSSVRGMATMSHGHHIPEVMFWEEALIGSRRAMRPPWRGGSGRVLRTAALREPHVEWRATALPRKELLSHEKSSKMPSSTNHRGLPWGCFPEQFSYMKNENAIFTISCQSPGELNDSIKKCLEESGTW